MSKTMYNAKRRATTVAKDLGYTYRNKAVISAIWLCESESEITRVLKTAREEM